MFTESCNGSGFYPTYSYPCAGCSASIYSSNLEALSQNHVSMCTACLHGAAAAFQYEAQAASLSTKCNNELNSANLLARSHHEEVNHVSGFPYGPLSAYVVDPLVPGLRFYTPLIGYLILHCLWLPFTWFLKTLTPLSNKYVSSMKRTKVKNRINKERPRNLGEQGKTPIPN